MTHILCQLLTSWIMTQKSERKELKVFIYLFMFYVDIHVLLSLYNFYVIRFRKKGKTFWIRWNGRAGFCCTIFVSVLNATVS